MYINIVLLIWRGTTYNHNNVQYEKFAKFYDVIEL